MFFCPLTVFDIDVRAVPLGDLSLFIAQRVRTKEEPSVLAVVPAQSRFSVSRFSNRHGALPFCQQTIQVISVDRRRPPPARPFFCGEAGVIEIGLVEEIGGSIRTRRPSHARNGIDDSFEIILTTL